MNIRQEIPASQLAGVRGLRPRLLGLTASPGPTQSVVGPGPARHPSPQPQAGLPQKVLLDNT